MLAILIALDCCRIGWVAWGLQRITDSQSTLQSEKSPYNPQNPLTIKNRVIKDCGRILGLGEDHYSTLFPKDLFSFFFVPVWKIVLVIAGK